MQLPLATWLVIDDAADADTVDDAAADMTLPLRDDRSGDSASNATDVAAADAVSTTATAPGAGAYKGSATATFPSFFSLPRSPAALGRADAGREESEDLRTVAVEGGGATEGSRLVGVG
jgi:hypothetical protein